MYTDDGTEIQTHGFAAQSFRFKGGLLYHIHKNVVGLLPKQIIANKTTFVYKNSRFDDKLLASCNLCNPMWFYIKY